MARFSYEPLTYFAHVFSSSKLEDMLGRFPDKDNYLKSLTYDNFGICPFDLLSFTAQLSESFPESRLLIYPDTHPIDERINLCLPVSSLDYVSENVMIFPFKANYASIRPSAIALLDEMNIMHKEKRIDDYPVIYAPATPAQFSKILGRISAYIGSPITEFD